MGGGKKHLHDMPRFRAEILRRCMKKMVGHLYLSLASNVNAFNFQVPTLWIRPRSTIMAHLP